LSVFPPLSAFQCRDSLLISVVDGGKLKLSICQKKSSREEKTPTQSLPQLDESSFEFTCDDKAPWFSLKENEEKNEQNYTLLEVALDFDLISRMFIQRFYKMLTPRSITENEIRVIGITSEETILLGLSLSLVYKDVSGKTCYKFVSVLFAFNFYFCTLKSVLFGDLNSFVKSNRTSLFHRFVESNYQANPTFLVASTDFYCNQIQRQNKELEIWYIKPLSSHLMVDGGCSIPKILVPHLNLVVYNDEVEE
jgi:hypothetical protein